MKTYSSSIPSLKERISAANYTKYELKFCIVIQSVIYSMSISYQYGSFIVSLLIMLMAFLFPRFSLLGSCLYQSLKLSWELQYWLNYDLSFSVHFWGAVQMNWKSATKLTQLGAWPDFQGDFRKHLYFLDEPNGTKNCQHISLPRQFRNQFWSRHDRLLGRQWQKSSIVE